MARVLAVDWGHVTLGLAVSDDLGITAQGLTSLRRVSEARDLEVIGKYVRELGVEAVVSACPRTWTEASVHRRSGPSVLPVPWNARWASLSIFGRAAHHPVSGAGAHRRRD